MTLAASARHEVRGTGSDTLCSGLFNPGNANMDATLTAAGGNTTTPVVSSANYTAVAGDVGSWVFIKSGTSWIPGWYPITGVSAGAMTLNAAVGAAILYLGSSYPNTIAGCSSVASPTAGTWTIDYSQQNAAKINAANLATTTGTGANPSITSSGNSFGVNFVGNHINITAGTSWTTGVYEIQSVSAGAATLDRACGSSATLSSGTYYIGGAFATPGQAGLVHVAGNIIHVKQATYTITQTTTGAGGVVSLTAGTASAATTIVGYNTTRWDNGTKPILQAGTITTFTLVTAAAGCVVSNITADGVSKTSSRCFTINASSFVERCLGKNATNNAFSGGTAVLCEATGCATTFAYTSVTALYCTAHDNTFTGFNTGTCCGCYSVNNSGASSDGFANGSTITQWVSCVAYNCGRDGFRCTASATTAVCVNCLSVSNAGINYNASAAMDQFRLYNCAGYSSGGATQAANVGSNITQAHVFGFIALTAQPFTNAAGYDFSLNSTSGGGASCQNAGIPGPSGTYALSGFSTASYLDVGGAQHTGGTTVTNIFSGGYLSG